jgi:hypothetical protein
MIGRRVLVLGLMLAGCKRPLTPEQQVRAALSAAEQAAQEKDLQALGGFLSEQYSDREQNDRQAVMGLLRLQFIRFPAIHLLVRVPHVGFPEPGRAEATALVAMAALPIAGPDELPRLSADLYRFDLVLGDEGKGHWRVRSAAWAPARAEDFLSPSGP